MVFIRLRQGESLEEALKRFKRECEKNGVLKEIKKREFYVPLSVKRKLKSQEAQRKLRRSRRKHR